MLYKSLKIKKFNYINIKIMKKIFIVLTLVWFGFIANSFAADLNRAWDAYEAGDYETAIKEFRPFAEQGHAIAQFSMGTMYDNGYGVLQDYKEAIKWYRLSAEQGHADAQYNLGGMYDDGDGVIQDYKEAFKWYRLAAEQGHISAQFNLGQSYREGKFIQDYKETFKWFRLAAEQGHVNAQYNLSIMYYKGDGVIKDIVFAYMWNNISASQGDEKAKANRDFLVKKMTASQIEKAQELARQCVRNNYKGC